MRFLDFFITTCLLFWTLFSSATRSIINASDSSKIAPSTVATQPNTSISVTKQTSTTSESTIKETTNTTFISNITTLPAIHTTSSLTVQTASTTIQPLATSISSYTSQTSISMTTTTSKTTQAPTISIPSQTTQTLTATTTTSNTTTQPTTTNISTNITQTLTSTTTTTSNSRELPTTNISSHKTQTSTAATTTNKTTKQPSNTFTHTTETSTPITTTSRNSTEPITTNISSHTSQHSTPTTTKTSNSTELPTTIIYSYTSQTSTPTTTATSNIIQTPNTNISSHTLQTSTPTTTTTSNSTELPTTNISSQTTQPSAPRTTTNSDTTIVYTASLSTQTSLLTTTLGQALSEETMTSANIPNQTTRESSNATTEEHIMNNSESTTSTENETSQRTSTQTKTTKISSSTSSYSTTPLTTNSRTTTSRPSEQQTTVNPVPDATLVPTEMLSLGINNTLRLKFTMLITNRNGSESFNETLFSYMLVRYVFVGYEVIPTVYASNPPSKNTRYRRDEIRALFITRTVDESNSNHEANYNIVANIPVIKLREQSKTIKEFVRDISNNIRHNISNITSPAWQAVNTSDEIEKQLESQTEGITECDASGKLCPLGYDCRPSNEDHYTGICVHKCDLDHEKKECKNNGHCIFDSMINKTACSCQSTWISLYYGSHCEEQTGKLETVIGFTLGSAVLVIVLVFTAVLCCIRNRDGVKEFRRHDDKSALESDFLSDSGGVQIMDLNYRKSTKFIPSSLDVDPVLKTLDPGPADVNVSEILETSGCSTISSSNSNKTFKEDENKRQESTMSSDSDVRKPDDNNYVSINFQSTCPPASTPEISRVSMKPKQENRTNNRQRSFLFGP